ENGFTEGDTCDFPGENVGWNGGGNSAAVEPQGRGGGAALSAAAQVAGGACGRRRGREPPGGSGELRLVDGGDRCAGRVEVKHDGEWGSVCVFSNLNRNAHWATLVCRQLGCGRVARSSPRIRFRQGTGRIWLQFFCRGSENVRGHARPAGTSHLCWSIPGRAEPCPWPGADAVELRLAGGDSPCAGRVEVKLQGQWGSVGDERWDMDDAEVVCQHLGCGSAAGAYSARERFGVGDGPVSLLYVNCNGDETILWDCYITGWGPFTNFHDLDTAVVCQGFSRLVGGDGVCAGQLEVQEGRAWVGVCEDQVDMKAAQVVCRELGCGEVLAMGGSGRFGAALGWFWDGCFQCNGSEPLLSACARRPAQSQGCSGRASIICSRKCRGQWGLLGSMQHPRPHRPPATAYTGFRLENSSSRCSGRVEVAVRGTWGSVCAAEWDLPDAHVLCRHLGCGRALAYRLGVQGLLLCGKSQKMGRVILVLPTVPRARGRYFCVVPGRGRAADAISNAVYEELDYMAMPEYQKVPSGPGGCS
ncbi:PREDICTED: LOW QUALITY PROTEIN: deleted in malignant brain tumors 1 protein-like, partial [Sturnus vulgaris]|uniref:LOW QUALITY PROTEIN: deleted in malignant brain tumors 1 protein-like n=1 Tax=Sturnus vulgaris TaxID=9172 RepID=UPI00071A2EB2